MFKMITMYIAVFSQLFLGAGCIQNRVNRDLRSPLDKRSTSTKFINLRHAAASERLSKVRVPSNNDSAAGSLRLVGITPQTSGLHLTEMDDSTIAIIAGSAVGAILLGGGAALIARSKLKAPKANFDSPTVYRPRADAPDFLSTRNVEVTRADLPKVRQDVDEKGVGYILTSEASLVKVKRQFEFNTVLGKLEDGTVLVGVGKKAESLKEFDTFRVKNLEDAMSIETLQRNGFFTKKFSHFVEEIPDLDVGRLNRIDDPFYGEILRDLDLLKTDLGAKKTTKAPQLDTSKTFLGFPVDTVQVWINKAIKKKWFPESFWKFVGRKFDIGVGGKTKYEYVYSTIVGLHNAKRAQYQVNHRLLNNDSATAFFQRETGLTFHASLNDPRVLVDTLDDSLFIFEAQYKLAKKQGRLKEFFNEAFDDSHVCFEARVRQLGDYSLKHPIGDNIPDTALIADYGPNPTMHRVIEKEIEIFHEVQRRAAVERGEAYQMGQVDRVEFKKFLAEKSEFYGKVEATPEGAEIRAIAEADVDDYIKYSDDNYLFIFNDID